MRGILWSSNDTATPSSFTGADLGGAPQRPWEADEMALAVRLAELEALRASGPQDYKAWPAGTAHFDSAVGVDESLYAWDPDARCRVLSRPARPPPRPGAPATRTPPTHPPVAVLLTGQLRTSEFTVPFMEELIVRASAPSPVHVFAHVWALKPQTTAGEAAPSGGEGGVGPSPAAGVMAATAVAASAAVAHEAARAQPFAASARAEARLRRMEGLAGLVVEDEARFEETVCAFYDARYGAGWCAKKVPPAPLHHASRKLPARDFRSNLIAFLSQWYKVTAAHGLLRRFYAAPSGKGHAFGPPLAILRLRADHLVTTRWNLTAAALEFSARTVAQAAGGNFLAIFGPTSHSAFCGPKPCAHFSQLATKIADRCYTAGRLDDSFAFGTPAAMDVYAAPYHPYQSIPHEEYVTATLPLGGLVQVGAARSAGGVYGSLGLPGSCNHRAGHPPLRARPLIWPHQSAAAGSDGAGDGAGRTGGGPSGGPSGGPAVVAGTNGGGGIWLEYVTREAEAQERAATRDNPGGLALRSPILFGDRIRSGDVSFDRLCAPVFYFAKFGVQMLRFDGALAKVQEAADALARSGACGPFLLPQQSLGGDGGGGVHVQVPGGGAGSSGGQRALRHAAAQCNDSRAGQAAALAAEGAPWVLAQIHPAGAPCECGAPVRLDLGLGANGSAVAAAQAAIDAHCAHVTAAVAEEHACRNRHNRTIAPRRQSLAERMRLIANKGALES